MEVLLRMTPDDALGLYVRARLELKAGRKPQALADLRLAAARRESPSFARGLRRAGVLFGIGLEGLRFWKLTAAGNDFVLVAGSSVRVCRAWRAGSATA